MLTAEQKKMRLSGCGGSEVAALLGVHPFMSAIDVYAAKAEGFEQDVEGNHNIERGNFFERPTADWWAHRRKATLRELGTIKDEANPLVICTPDFIGSPQGEGDVDLSIKSPGPYSNGWGEAGTDEVPPYALIQVQYELIPLGRLHGITRAEVAAVINGDLRTYQIPADAELQALLLDAVSRFWRDHVLPKRPPSPDGSERYTAWRKRHLPEASGKVLEATPEVEAWARQLAKARADAEDAKRRVAAASDAICAFLTDAGADGVKGRDWRASYKMSKGRASTDWEAVMDEAKIDRAIIDRHTKRTPFPVFKPTFAGEK